MERLCSRKGPSGNWQEHEAEDGHRKVAGAGFMMEKQFRVVRQLRLGHSKDGENQAIDRSPFFYQNFGILECLLTVRKNKL